MKRPLVLISDFALVLISNFCFLILLCVSVSLWPSLASAQTLDQVVASIGNTAITQSDVDAEYRFEVFLTEGHLPASPPDAATFARVRDRLIDQRLLTQEAAAEGIQPEDVHQAAERRLTDARKKCKSEDAFQSSLRSLGLTEAQLLDRLAEQERTLRMIDQRMRPSVTVEPAEIEAYYRDTFTPDYSKHNPGEAVPPLAQVESQIREVLAQKKIDQQLAAWLNELKVTHHVRLEQ
jgi:hypothetical protein